MTESDIMELIEALAVAVEDRTTWIRVAAWNGALPVPSVHVAEVLRNIEPQPSRAMAMAEHTIDPVVKDQLAELRDLGRDAAQGARAAATVARVHGAKEDQSVVRTI